MVFTCQTTTHTHASFRGIVTMVERWFPKPEVRGSSPFSPAKDEMENVMCVFKDFFWLFLEKWLSGL